MQPQVDAIKTAQAAISGRLAFAQSITEHAHELGQGAERLRRIIPTNSYLTSIAVTAPVTAASAAAAAAAPTTLPSTDATGTTDATAAAAPAAPSSLSTLTLAGTAPSTPGVALVMDRLSLLPWLSNVALTSASRHGHRFEHLQPDGKRLGGSLMARMNGIMGVVVSSLAVLVVVIVGWFFFVSPQRSKADTPRHPGRTRRRTELSGDEQLIATAKKQNTLGNAKAAERALPDTPRCRRSCVS